MRRPALFYKSIIHFWFSVFSAVNSLIRDENYVMVGAKYQETLYGWCKIPIDSVWFLLITLN